MCIAMGTCGILMVTIPPKQLDFKLDTWGEDGEGGGTVTVANVDKFIPLELS